MAEEAGAARLSASGRSAALAALAGSEHQVLVVGGGVVGAGVALDAATRGLSVGLVEARDFASGTSSRSSKLIHGGLRYLEQLNVGLVREALTERALLLGVIAPHLVRPVPFVFPLTHRVWERAYVGTGVGTYDVLGFSLGQSRGLPGHRQLSRRGALQLVPGLKRSAITWASQNAIAPVIADRLSPGTRRSAPCRDSCRCPGSPLACPSENPSTS